MVAIRRILSRSRLSSALVTDLVGSMLAIELLAPSPQIYVMSPWITEAPLFLGGQVELRAILAGVTKREIVLSDLIGRLGERGSAVRIVCRSGSEQTDQFLASLGERVEVRRHDKLHAKGIITDHAVLSGSMNFTYNGLVLNDEYVELQTDPAAVAKAQLEAEGYWESLAA